MMLALVLVTVFLFGESSAQSCPAGESTVVTDVTCGYDNSGKTSCSPFPGRFVFGVVSRAEPATAVCSVNSEGAVSANEPALCFLQVVSCDVSEESPSSDSDSSDSDSSDSDSSDSDSSDESK